MVMEHVPGVHLEVLNTYDMAEKLAQIPVVVVVAVVAAAVEDTRHHAMMPSVDEPAVVAGYYYYYYWCCRCCWYCCYMTAYAMPVTELLQVVANKQESVRVALAAKVDAAPRQSVATGLAAGGWTVRADNLALKMALVVAVLRQKRERLTHDCSRQPMNAIGSDDLNAQYPPALWRH